MKSVLISIRPEWVEKILNGEKTVEVRKTAPKITTPFKCYIYCTKGDLSYKTPGGMICHNNGGMVVVGEFVCDFIVQYEAELWDDDTFERITEVYEPDDFAEYGEYEHKTIADNSDDFWKDNMLCKASCVSIEELRKYIGTGIHQFYGWHISELKIYDKKKEIGDFKVRVTNKIWSFTKKLERPPQSWCYVEQSEK